MAEMVERVARAICLAGEVPDDVPKDCESLCRMCSDEAKAAIAAMRVPTREMIDVGNTVSEDAGDICVPSDGIFFNGPLCGLEVWQTMIDAALKEES